MPAFLPSGLGWRPDLPDPRDYQPDREELAKAFGRLKRRSCVPRRVDWRDFCPAAEASAPLAAGAARACVSLLQYFQRRATGEIIEPSAAFVDHTTRRSLLGTNQPATEACSPCRAKPGDLSRRIGNRFRQEHGEQLRATWKAIVRFGVPRIQDWPSRKANLGLEPDAFAYAAAMKFPGLRYVRLDGREQGAEAALEAIKSFLAAGFASVFGFSVCTSVSAEADIPYSTIFDGIRGGRAALAVGYDDKHRVRSWRGALLINPSWGDSWGEGGYGWLPYATTFKLAFYVC